MVTVSIKIKQKKNVYIRSCICGICSVKMYMWIKGNVPVYFGVVGQSSALCPAAQHPPTCLTLPPPWPLPPPPVVFSKVISTSVFPGLGGSVWGLSVCLSVHV